jgi:hypothetical protein
MEHSGNILGECHAPYKLNISYTEFEKELLHRFRYKRLVFRPYPTLHTFWVTSNVVGPVHPSIPYFYMLFIYFLSGIKCCWTSSPIHPLFLYAFYILCWTWSRLEYNWNPIHWTIKQSRCDSILLNDTSSFYKHWRWQGDTVNRK